MFSQTRFLLVIGVLCAGCVPTWIALIPGTESSRFVSTNGTLSNLLRAAPNVFSGGEPKDSDDFATLARLGVRTVVSVDGVRPNLETAAQHGLEYVQIPIGYDGVDRQAQHSLVRLVRDREGPFYIHCHHGKHRGPAAAAIVCRSLGDFDGGKALEFLKRAGTDPLYLGLYRDVRNFKIPPKDTPLPDLVSVAEVGSLAMQMAKIDRIFDRLSEKIRSEDTLLLLEAFREAARSLEKTGSPRTDLLDALRTSIDECRDLHDADGLTARNVILDRVSARCTECHIRFRDIN